MPGREKVYFEVLTDEGHEYFESEKEAYALFRKGVERNINIAVDQITLINRLFRKPLMRKECILDYERV